MKIRSGPFFKAGQSVSEVISLDQLRPYLIITPAAWTKANLQFLYSPDNANFYPLHMENHRWEMVCPPNAVVKLALEGWPTFSFFKFVSATGGSEIPQQQDGWFQVIGD